MLDWISAKALRRLRLELEESTSPEQWPQAAADELMLLNDVLLALGALEGQRRFILGEAAIRFLDERIVHEGG